MGERRPASSAGESDSRCAMRDELKIGLSKGSVLKILCLQKGVHRQARPEPRDGGGRQQVPA